MTGKNTLYASVGVGSIWVMVYGMFPQIGSQPVLGSSVGVAAVGWQLSALTAFIVGALLAVLLRSQISRRLLLSINAGASLLQLGGLFVLPSLVELGHVTTVVSGVLAGTTGPLVFLTWGELLARIEVGQAELTLLLSMLLAAIGYLIVTNIAIIVSLMVFGVLTINQFLAYRICSLSIDGALRDKGAFPAAQTSVKQSDTVVLIKVFVRCVLAYALVAFAWDSQRMKNEIFGIEPLYLFAIGLILAVLIFWLFTTYVPRVGIISSTHWVFPIMAIAVLLSNVGGVAGFMVALIALAAAHASTEIMLRASIVSLAHRNPQLRLRIVAIGFASISLGVAIGVVTSSILKTALFNHAQFSVVVLAALVVIAPLFFSPARPSVLSVPEERWDDMQTINTLAQQYGFTPRETEILGFLIEGRSSPYIRDELIISKSTVDTHIRHIYKKMGISSKQALISIAKNARLHIRNQ